LYLRVSCTCKNSEEEAEEAPAMFKYKILVTETGIRSGKHRKEQRGIDNIVDKVDISLYISNIVGARYTTLA
jgi:hypothetical protein